MNTHAHTTAASTIRLLHPDDLPGLLAGCWQGRSGTAAHATLESLRTTTLRDTAFVIPSQACIIAFGRLTAWQHGGEISDLSVAPAYRSQGYGTALIRHLVAQAQDWGLERVEIGAATHNDRALALYERLGFRPCGIRLLDLGRGEERVQYLRLLLRDIPKPEHPPLLQS